MMTFICRPASVDIWYIHWIFTHKKEKTTTTTKQVKRNLMSTLEFRDVLDGISEACSMIFLYLEFDMNKYLKNWGSYEVLRKIGGFIIIVITIFSLALYGILRCAAMILSANFGFAYIDRLIPIIASLFWCIFVCIYTYSTS